MIKEILATFALNDANVTKLTSGLINQTYLASTGDKKIIIQQLGPIFAVDVMTDIQAVTIHLSSKGVAVPHLIPLPNGDLFHRDSAGNIWRALSWLPGRTYEAPTSAALCYSAGQLLGLYHLSLSDFPGTFANVRPHVHESKWHFGALKEVIDTSITDWSDLPLLQKLAHSLLEKEQELLDFANFPSGIVHGDPKIANFLFNDEKATALIDLDTFAKRALITEIGDALRSFAASGADGENCHFNHSFCEAFCEGYRSTNPDFFTVHTIADMKKAAYTITLELAARFAKEAFVPKYFSWDKRRFSSAHDHNLARLQNLLNFAASFPSF